MTTNRPEFQAHDDFIFEHKEVGKVTREEFIKYIRSSHEHMRKLSQIIQQYNQTIDEYLNEWDGKFESFDDDVKDLLGRWIQDGTMDHIINENLMSTKADKSYVDDLNENVTAQLAQMATYIPIDNYKHLFNGVDVTQAFIQALADAPNGSTITFNPKSKYELSDSGISDDYNLQIDKPITVDFNHAEVNLKVTGKVVFELKHAGERDFHNRIKLINYSFKTETGFIPTNIIRINSAINTLLDGSMERCKASHSLIWNRRGYGTHIYGEARYSDTPRVIYLSHSNSLYEHSYMMDIDIDITGNSGVGIETEGGGGSIKGVIETCKGGGYYYNGVNIAHALVISVHMENNDLFDFQIGTDESSEGGSKNTGLTTILGSLVNSKSGNPLIYGATQNIDIVGSMMFGGTFKPLEQGKRGSTVINVIGSRTPKTIPDPDRNVMNVIGGYDSQLKRLIVNGNVTFDDINTKSGRLKSNTFFRIFPEGSKTGILYIYENRIVPTIKDFDLGSGWSRFSSVFANKINLRSPNGHQWDITVDNEGTLKTTRTE